MKGKRSDDAISDDAINAVTQDRTCTGTLPQTTPSPGVVVAGTQSNHGDFCLPPEMAHLPHLRLYQAVALWALTVGSGVTRDDISRAFRISVRRAADVMHYILAARQDVITCTRQVIRLGQGRGRTLLLHVTAVSAMSDEPRQSMSPSASPRKPRPAPVRKERVSQALRSWFLTRPNPQLPE